MIAVEKGDYASLKFNHYYGPQLVQFCYRFIPTFLVLYFGSGFATKIIGIFPVNSFVMRTLTALGGLLPAVGVAILLTMVIKKNIQIVQFLFGFALVAALKMNMISIAIVGSILRISYTSTTPVQRQ